MKFLRPAAEYVVIILATGISIALLTLTASVVLALTKGSEGFEASRVVAVTTVLTGWGGGAIGVIGAYIGYAFGVRDGKKQVIQLD